MIMIRQQDFDGFLRRPEEYPDMELEKTSDGLWNLELVNKAEVKL